MKPDEQAQADRQTAVARRRQGLLGRAILLLLFGAAFMGYGGWMWTRERAFDTRGRRVTATVVGVDRGSPAIVRFSYEADGLPYAGRSPFRAEDAAWMRAGTHLEVRYLPERPERAIAVGALRRQAPLLLLVGAINLAVGVAFLAMLRRPKRPLP